MDADPRTSQKALAVRFICSSDDDRYDMITDHLDSLLDYEANSPPQDSTVRTSLVATACSMFARYAMSAKNFSTLHCDAYGPDPSPPGETQTDFLHRMAGKMGYPADAARHFFDCLVAKQDLIYRNVVLEIPDSIDKDRSIEEGLLDLNEWYSRVYDTSAIVPYTIMPAPACDQCFGSPKPCMMFPGLTRKGCGECILRSRHCSLPDRGQGDMGQFVADALGRLSTAVSQLNSSVRATNTLPPGLPQPMLPKAREDV